MLVYQQRLFDLMNKAYEVVRVGDDLELRFEERVGSLIEPPHWCSYERVVTYLRDEMFYEYVMYVRSSSLVTILLRDFNLEYPNKQLFYEEKRKK